jgi:hypothetical protein
MSEENVEIVQRVLGAFNSGGQEKLAEELVEPNAPFEPLLAGVQGATYRGASGIMRWIGEMNETFADVHADISKIEELDDVLLLTGKTTGWGRGAGVPIEQPWVIATQFRRGRLSYGKICRTRAEALEAAGLSE